MFAVKRKLAGWSRSTTLWRRAGGHRPAACLSTSVGGLGGDGGAGDVGGDGQRINKVRQPNAFLQHLHESVYQLESAVGCTQRRLGDNLQMLFTSLDTLKSRHYNTMATAESEFSGVRPAPPQRLPTDPIKNREYINQIIDSVQMKYSTQINFNSSSSPSFPGNNSLFASMNMAPQASAEAPMEKPLIEMIDDQINEHVLPDQVFNTHLSRGAPPKSNLNPLPGNLQAIFPKDYFMLFVMAKLLMTNIFSSGLVNACAQLSPTEQNDLNRHLFFLLNIINLMQKAIDNRRALNIGPKSPKSSSSSSVSEVLIFGNVCFYNITYMLMKLNMQNISELISATLKDFTTIEYSIDKEMPNFFVWDKAAGDDLELVITPAFFEMLCSGQLLHNWHQMFHYQQLNLLATGCQAIAYLFGKEVQYECRLIQTLGYNLASTLSLVDDYYCLKYAYPAQTDLSALTAGPSQAMSFLFRLPVLLHLKEVLKPEQYEDLKSAPKLIDMVKKREFLD